MIEVAVIGAGSAGLVTARHLVANGLKCCVFEATSVLGGAWSTLPSTSPIEGDGRKPKNGLMWEGLHTNLSKHTCRFSDFPWPSETSTFPSKEDMDSYLTSYAEEFLLNNEEISVSPCSFLYDCRVTRVSPTQDQSIDAQQQYRVEWTDSVRQTKHSKEFGGVVVATGFFSKPKYPSMLLTEISPICTDNISIHDKLKIIHAKEYGSHKNFDPDTTENENIVIIGSSHSAVEIAVDVSQSSDNPVTIIMSKVPWVLPRYVPDTTAKNPTFLPVDFALYRRTSEHESTKLTPETCLEKHKGLHKLLGSRQEKILPVPRTSWHGPPFVAISDYFLDLVADGRIKVVHGRLESVDGKKLKVVSTKKDDRESIVIPNVSCAICCTGYLPDLESIFGIQDDESLSVSSILKTIDYDQMDSFSPMTTYLETLHPGLKNFAFVGMYRGAYMGVIELQARLAAGVMSGKISISPEDYDAGLRVSEEIRSQDPFLRPQFPRFDYPGFLDSLANIVFSRPLPKRNVGDVITPTMYQPDPIIAESSRKEIEQQVESGGTGQHLPSVVTSSLVGSWSFERDIVHFSNGGRSIAQRQYIHGTVRYSRSKDLSHVLYREDGFFEISDSKSLPVFREYEYVVSSDGRALELYFVEGGKRTYIFLSLRFQHQDDDGYWVATNDHLCVKDLYTGKFRIKLDGLAATEVIITYRVKGPAKDYESTTIMRPH